MREPRSLTIARLIWMRGGVVAMVYIADLMALGFCIETLEAKYRA